MKNLTKAKALRVQAMIIEFLGTDEVRLYEPGFHADGWTLALEGDYDWPMRVSEALFLKEISLPADVFVEPVNGWCLGLYPELS